MTVSNIAPNRFAKSIYIASSILVSGLCWYFSCGLSGDYWWLLWIAPVPVMIYSLKSTGKQSFIISFLAYLIGRLSWFSYLVTVATIVPAIVFTLALPLVFALIMVVVRRTIINSNSPLSIFAFPVFFTTFEFLFTTFAPDGTAGSIAYSQSNFLPLIQIASVTGISGITFFVTFIPSVIALAWYHRREKMKLQYIAGVAMPIITAVLVFGIIRINAVSENKTIKTGLAVIDEKFHYFTLHPDLKKETETAGMYAKQITLLAEQGARIVILPERANNISNQTDSAVLHILTAAAKQNHVTLIVGYTDFKQASEKNSALVIDADGTLIANYNKVHLVTGLEDQFTPGKEIALFNLNGIQAGTAICKDLDFPLYIKKYAKNNLVVLFVPAWDFVVDGWLHSRMAILRGVENGFSEVRTARQGRLTISDPYGRVTYEADCSNNYGAALVGNVFLEKKSTVYTKFGDWFGIIDLIAAIFFILYARKPRKGAATANATF